MNPLLLCTWLAGAARSEPALTVEIEGLTLLTGDAIVAVFGPEDDWLDLDHPSARAVVPVQGPTLRQTFTGLAPGRWAVAVVHDMNRNGELDIRWLPWPRMLEPVGMSNDPHSAIGPPGFSSAAFTLPAEGATVTVHLQTVGG